MSALGQKRRFPLVLGMPGIKAAPISSACECAHIITPRLDSRFNASIQILQMRKLFNAGFHLDVAPIEAMRTLQCEQATKLKYGKPQSFCTIDRLAEFCL